MKRCPHCGAAIKVSAAAFCSRCKRPLRKPGNAPDANTVNLSQKVIPPQNHQTHMNNPRRKKKPGFWELLMPIKKKPPVSERIPVNKPKDENYDGYYEDRPTDDNAQNKESYDPEMIKRIVLIAGGAVLLVVFSIVIMNLL